MLKADIAETSLVTTSSLNLRLMLQLDGSFRGALTMELFHEVTGMDLLISKVLLDSFSL